MMGFREVQDLNADVTYSLGGINKKTGKANPKSKEGYYLGKRKVESRKAKSGYAYIYILQAVEGNIGVWGKTDMDRKMTAAVPGHMIRITHTGMIPTPNGDMYKFKVEFDDTNTIEVSAALQSQDNDDTGSDGRTQDDNEDPQNEEQAYEEATEQALDEEDNAQAVALAAAERKAKIQSLLKGNKKTA